MMPRLPVVLGLAFLGVLPALCGCSTSHRRDQNFGTDAGSEYQIPDAADFPSQAGADANAEDASADIGLEAVPADTSTQDSDSGFDS
jgi:hypothetical protein